MPRGPAVADASGNAMVVALLVLMLMTAAGVTFVAVTKSEKQIAGNQMSGTQAMYSAEAGISEALLRMNNPSDVANYIGPPAPIPAWGRYLVVAAGASKLDAEGSLQASDGWDNNQNSFVDESGERYPEVVSKQLAAKDAPVYPYVRVEYKMRSNQLVRFGDADGNAATPPVENLSQGAPVLRLTALGQRGNANKVIEAEAVRFPFVDVNSAVWAGGKLKLNGNAFLVDGNDHEMFAPYDTIPGATPVRGILSEGPTTEVPLGPGQGDNILGAGGTSSIAQSTYTYDFNAIAAGAVDMADNKLAGGTTLTGADPPLGTVANPKFTYVDGELKVSGTWTGAGILVVKGNLSFSGGSQFKGIVVCLGDLKYTGAGPADMAHVVGGLIYQGTMIDDSSLGGAGRLFYSSAAVNNALMLSRYKLASWRER
jgi:hypothetical protein